MEIRTADETYRTVLFRRHVHVACGHENGKTAAERGLDLNIYAIPEQNLRDELELHGGDIQAVLLGPQVRFKLAENKNSPTSIRSRSRSLILSLMARLTARKFSIRRYLW